MQAKELMVGDWVRYVDKDVATRVEAIAPKDPAKPKIYEFTLRWGIFTFKAPISGVRPIPLDSGILERNGFEYVTPKVSDTLSEDRVWRIEHQYGAYCLELEEQEDDNGNEYYYVRGYCGAQNVELVISKVHELQHALRMLYIDKDIEL